MSNKNFAWFLGNGVKILKKANDLNENYTMIFRLLENPTLEVLISYLQKCGILQFFFRTGKISDVCFSSRCDRNESMVLRN